MSSCPPSTPAFPTEVTEQIIDAVSLRDRNTLRTCNVVCRAWLPRARWNLYREIDLSLRNRTQHPIRTDLFAATIEANPHLGELVETLHFGCDLPGRAFGTVAILNPALRGQRGPKRYDVLRLARLCNVRTLHLNESNFDCHADFLEMLGFFPLLESLFLIRVEIHEPWNDAVAAEAPAVLQRKQGVIKLEIGTARLVLPVLVAGCAPGGMFAHVRSLDIQDAYRTSADGEWLRLPALLHGTLEELRVSFTSAAHYDDPPGERDDLLQRRSIAVVESTRGCTRLRSLHIECCAFGRHDLEFYAVPFVILAKHLPQTLPDLRVLTLNLSCWIVEVLFPGIEDLSPALARTVQDRTRFPALGHFVVCLRNLYIFQGASFVRELETQVRGEFAGFREDSGVELIVKVL